MVPAEPSSDAGVLVLRLGAVRLAVALRDVAEVLPRCPVTRVPGGTAWLAGAVNWRGRVLPVLDLRPLLRLDTPPLPGSARLVVLRREGATLGLLAEAVPEIRHGGAGRTTAVPPLLPAAARELLCGTVVDDDGPLAVVDAAAVFRLRERLGVA